MKALIIGGGVAGPAAAMALRKVGIDATIYEAYRGTAHDIGATMGIYTNGLAALEVLGAHEPVRDAGFPVPRGVLWLGNGKRLGEAETGTPLSDGTMAIQLLRADLYAALHRTALDRGITFEHDKRLASVDHQGDKVVARFTDGSHATGDILIGADGMRSVTRTFVDPDAPRPRYSGIVGTGGVARDTGLAPTPGAFHMVFGKRAFLGYTIREDDGSAWWFVNLPWREEPTEAELAAIGNEQWRRRLLELFGDDPSPARRMIEATPADYNWYVSHEMAAPSTWYRGRAVLVGDAAHVTSPSSGQGASMAIEDAVELARCLRDRDRVEDAFAAYQGLREGRVAKVAASARQTNRSKSATGMSRVLRDALFPMFMKKFSKPDTFAWLYDHRIDFDRPVAG